MSKVVKACVRLSLPAGKAAPSAQLGQAVGALGVNMMDLSKIFNSMTEKYVPSLPMRCQLTVYQDRSFDLKVKLPPAAHFIKLAANIEKAAAMPGRETSGEVSVRQLYEIGKLKMLDFENQDRAPPLQSVVRSLVGTCKSLGLKLVP